MHPAAVVRRLLCSFFQLNQPQAFNITMPLSPSQLQSIFRSRKVSATDLDARGMWLSGMIQGSGMELKDWGDFATFNRQNQAPRLDYEAEFQRYILTAEWLVCEPDAPRAYTS